MVQFKAQGANEGLASGRICLVHDTDEFEHCLAGDIVLLNKVKPNAKLVERSAGILAIHGGIASHAAIAAREASKPCIVGLPESVLEQITDGVEVEMDGQSGVVNLIKE